MSQCGQHNNVETSQPEQIGSSTCEQQSHIRISQTERIASSALAIGIMAGPAVFVGYPFQQLFRREVERRDHSPLRQVALEKFPLSKSPIWHFFFNKILINSTLSVPSKISFLLPFFYAAHCTHNTGYELHGKIAAGITSGVLQASITYVGRMAQLQEVRSVTWGYAAQQFSFVNIRANFVPYTGGMIFMNSVTYFPYEFAKEKIAEKHPGYTEGQVKRRAALYTIPLMQVPNTMMDFFVTRRMSLRKMPLYSWRSGVMMFVWRLCNKTVENATLLTLAELIKEKAEQGFMECRQQSMGYVSGFFKCADAVTGKTTDLIYGLLKPPR